MILLHDLLGISDKFLSLWCKHDSPVGPDKMVIPASSSSSRTTADRLGCETNNFRDASFMERLSAIVIT